MEKLNGYKKRFFQLMESTMGDVKPLINEQNPQPAKPTPTQAPKQQPATPKPSAQTTQQKPQSQTTQTKPQTQSTQTKPQTQSTQPKPVQTTKPQPPPQVQSQAKEKADTTIKNIYKTLNTKFNQLNPDSKLPFQMTQSGTLYGGDKFNNAQIKFMPQDGNLVYIRQTNTPEQQEPIVVKIYDKDGNLLPNADKLISDFQQKVLNQKLEKSIVNTNPEGIKGLQ